MFQRKTAEKEGAVVRRFEMGTYVTGQLLSKPGRVINNKMQGVDYSARIIVPDYESLMRDYYKDVLEYELNHYYKTLNLPSVFTHFGLCIDFAEPTELHLHGDDMALPSNVKSLLKEFGILVMRNVFLDVSVRDMGHRNRFPQLNFHIDRHPEQEAHYSVYTRNPFDDEQRAPRTSSTVFMPTLAAYLQGLTEGKTELVNEKGSIVNAELFDKNSILEVMNRIVVAHEWNQPEGTGEISMIDNNNVLHASFYPDIHNKGYRIGVRYLS